MIVFGWGDGKITDYGAVAPEVCPNCHNQVFFRAVKSTTWFSLFFIPVFPYGTRYLLVCPTCTHAFEMTAEQAKRSRALADTYERWRSRAVSDAEYEREVTSFWESIRDIEHVLEAHAQGARRELPLRAPVTNEFGGVWHPDPTGRHQYRFWDGSWTAFVRDGHETDTDAHLAPTAAGWFPDPELRHERRYWDGRTWTVHVQDSGVPGVDPL